MRMRMMTNKQTGVMCEGLLHLLNLRNPRNLLSLLMCSLMSSGLIAAPLHEMQLDNGLQIRVREDHRAPVVVSQIWYKVGSSYEPSGLTGISHALEHMMFKGTKTLGPNEFSRSIAAEGGSENAFTSRDYTAYFQRLEKERLEISFRLEADRMRHLVLDPAEFAKEQQVIAEERRLRTDDVPESLTFEQFIATAYLTSPYRHPIIGWMSDIQNMAINDLRKWYERWYAPNNAILVVVGDVDPQQVFGLAQKHFGGLQPSDLTPPRDQPEIPQRGERRITVRVPANVPSLMMGYGVPTLATASKLAGSERERALQSVYALEVLTNILDGGDSGRLSRELIRGQKVAAEAAASYNLVARLDDLLTLVANPAPGRTLADVEQALRNQIQRLQEELVTAEELQRVIARVVAADVYQQDSMFYQGMRIGILETVGLGATALDDYVARIQSVTPEQVQAVARAYLTPDRITVALLEPLPLAAPVSSTPPSALKTPYIQ